MNIKYIRKHFNKKYNSIEGNYFRQKGTIVSLLRYSPQPVILPRRRETRSAQVKD